MSQLPALTLVNRALQEIGLPQVPTVVSEQDDETGFQTLGLLNALGNQLMRVHDWQLLEKSQSYTGDGVTDSFPLPADWGRIVNQTQWASKNKRPMFGPMSPQGWAWLQFGIVSIGVYYRYRILGDRFHVFPAPSPGEEINFYYISRNWVWNPITEQFQDFINADSDVPVYDDYLMIAGMKFKLWAAKGMETTVLGNEFDYMLESVKAQDQGAPVISLDRRWDHLYISNQNVPDGGFNV